ncbi:unnamed protein product [Vitrella brassicaformis CCMP3155]|uniref:Uncharacterized protein n=1 Tax=Vitrella brassicaformis (strain CCMP3155) TaxID=1169540 RepID=A0A0G4FM74_VITBC|nr:unnamed protein product [Vitrella brassicaformis CCMP3155]|mmetsp:Transcript_17554/g.42175  ORF Transcript_17554/g.42175 Transcript_17554/m.42175 type:complete len:87 (+) Transcript_17554:98-358(+)|eukprot:CEM15084.1 unnamed protein product [Vitrella brassicaformis CCMP3155]
MSGKDQYKSSGWNAQGNRWTDRGDGNAQGGSYRYDNYDGQGVNRSYYYQNANGSTYHGTKDAQGNQTGGTYTRPNENPRYVGAPKK